MKSPIDIATRMRRQWQRNPFRLELLTAVDSWPKRYPIGLPTSKDLASAPSALREHAKSWQRVSIGRVEWREMHFRASSEPIQMPSHWVLERPSEWVRASNDRDVIADFNLLEFLLERGDAVFRDPLILNRQLLQGRSQEELLAAVELAARLNPGEAMGRPLRLLAGHGVDTKFFERNATLLIRLLDARFDATVSELGLHTFLDAAPDGEHWLLVVPLQEGLMPFQRMQVRSSELACLSVDSTNALNVLVIENRQCLHSLPKLANTIAILGAGLDLDWLRASWLDDKRIAYWGDIDTWGLAMLARARHCRPNLTPLLMNNEVFEHYDKNNAVEETVTAGSEPPDELNYDEKWLYHQLLASNRGRLEQEYLPEELVHESLTTWLDSM